MAVQSIQRDMVEIARSLRPRIEAHSAECQQLRHLSEGVAQLLREHGIFGMSRPTALGGLGIDLLTTLRTVEEISIADASVGWCAAIGSGSIGQVDLPEEVARKVYQPGAFIAGVGAPNGRAVAVDGGYRVTGRWGYASGCQSADWVFLGTIAFEGERPRPGPDGLPEIRMAVVSAKEVEVIDTWDVSGLRGTGSHDVAVNDLFIPDDHTATMFATTSRKVGADYRIPMFTLFGLALAPVAIGAGRRAIDELVARASGKTPLMAGSKLSEKPVTQYEIARAEAMLEAGRAYLYDQVARMLERAGRGEDIDIEMRARVRLAAAHAVDSASQATAIAYRLGGGTSNYESSMLQRCLRDVNAVTQHFMVSSANYETTGRVLLGLEPILPALF